MGSDPVYEWPIDIVNGKIICAAPKLPVPDPRFKLGVRTDTCEMVIARFFTIHEMMDELRTHIATAMHDLEFDWGDLVGHHDVPLPVYIPLTGPIHFRLPSGGVISSGAGYTSSGAGYASGGTVVTTVSGGGGGGGSAHSTTVYWME